MFEKHREKKAQGNYEKALQHWQAERDGQAEAIEMARSHGGSPTSELMLKKGEALIAKVAGVGLIELRKGQGQWQGRSSGVSIPVGSLGGRSVRYRVGASKGHYVQGTPKLERVRTVARHMAG
jgi:hypothetical protein